MDTPTLISKHNYKTVKDLKNSERLSRFAFSYICCLKASSVGKHIFPFESASLMIYFQLMWYRNTELWIRVRYWIGSQLNQWERILVLNLRVSDRSIHTLYYSKLLTSYDLGRVCEVNKWKLGIVDSTNFSRTIWG